ncbi:MAG: ribosome biogenesis factor YjgA [Desulfosarcinaceae bacterium]
MHDFIDSRINEMSIDTEPVPSRTQKKKAAQQLQALGRRLAALNDAQLEAFDPMPQELHVAIVELRAMKSHEARRRQLKYIGRIMRQVDSEQLEAGLKDMALRDDEINFRFKQLEVWRDQLVGGDDDLLNTLLEQYPAVERQPLVRLVRNARKLAGTDKASGAGRKVFRYLKERITDPGA